MKLKRIIHDVAGASMYRDALFYSFPGGLRFGLSEGGAPFDQVLQALNKATLVCGGVFDGCTRILVHLQTFAWSSPFAVRRAIHELAEAGIDLPAGKEVWYEKVEESDDFGDGVWVHCAFEAPASKLQNLLWCAVVTDFPSLRPNPHCQLFLVNPKTGLIVHPYDDRGMDVIGRNTPALKVLYETYNAWLLDYDRETMDATFKPK